MNKLLYTNRAFFLGLVGLRTEDAIRTECMSVTGETAGCDRATGS